MQLRQKGREGSHRSCQHCPNKVRTCHFKKDAWGILLFITYNYRLVKKSSIFKALFQQLYHSERHFLYGKYQLKPLLPPPSKGPCCRSRSLKWVPLLFRIVLNIFTDTNPKSFEIGEIFALEALESGRSDLVICVLEFWKGLNKAVNEGVSSSSIDSLMYWARI